MPGQGTDDYARGNKMQTDVLKPEPLEPEVLVVTLNARLQPVHRGELFEDPLDEVLRNHGLGEVCGGGTGTTEEGEVAYCDIEVLLSNPTPENIELLIGVFNSMGTPKGSALRRNRDEGVTRFGNLEGLGLYLNGTDLADEVYEQCEPTFVHNEITRLIEGNGEIYSYWQGPSDTALYLYGPSFEVMKEKINAFLNTYPLCQKCRVEQIA
ncbi:Uncharacterized protein ALO54_01378 [Pseudomonas syringae pv. philadelphi]|uniref:Uncharacterized protein n=2 Tax=Pseudomonas TaxID=286 RepID=A0A0Q0CQ49_PSESX|nr:Uncharacterized protein ALO54_01378 [Pseudomonas syringae pv. philadelphi]KPY86885.1 Uncharacterized protein ALO94_01777 [Pseudomonas syringae pv. spinaceae]RMP69348.1 hypothetical protein ALQ19_03379 [Pseudomonas syringae pv. berberidis]RMQ39721.1 hypothetical protein ALQ06_00749 [Pseudomonas syringae pv. berberidis]RMT34653.1 hypothetical protein ALP50_01242 [Pseudomonas syringae pv. spinaceae]